MQYSVPIWEAGYSIKQGWKEARARLWDDFERYKVRISEVRGMVYVHTHTMGMVEAEGSEVILMRARKFVRAQRQESVRKAGERVWKREREKKEEKNEREYFDEEGDNMMYQTNGHMWRCTPGNCYCPEQDLTGANYDGVVSNKGEVRKLPFIKRTSAEMLLRRPVKMSRKQIDIFYGIANATAPEEK